MALLFSEAELFMQFWKRALWDQTQLRVVKQHISEDF